jgi:hypothetical protein
MWKATRYNETRNRKIARAGDFGMNKTSYWIALAASTAIVFLGSVVSLAQETSSQPPAKKEQADAGKEHGRQADRPMRDERRMAKPEEGDFEGPPPGPKPRRDFDGALPRSPEGDRGGPRWKSDEGGFDGRPPMLRREGDRDRMGPPFSDRSMPMGPPRWPHEDWGSMEKNDPEMYQLLKSDMDLDRQARELAMQYTRAPKDQREKIRQQVQELVDKHFEVRQQRRSLELKRLEDELKRLREAMERREKARKELVGKRVTSLLGTDDEVGF